MSFYIKSSYLAARMPSIIAQIKIRLKLSTLEAFLKFYRSKTYEMLISNEITLGDLSSPLIVDMFEEELKNGSFDYPEVI